jgi:hypothetical protein
MKPYHARSIFVIPLEVAGTTPTGLFVDPGLVLRKPLEVWEDGKQRHVDAPDELRMKRYEAPKTRGIVTAIGDGVHEVRAGDIVGFPPHAYHGCDQVSPYEYAMHIDNVLVILDHWAVEEMETAGASSYY